jgi:hypothetical protein
MDFDLIEAMRLSLGSSEFRDHIDAIECLLFQLKRKVSVLSQLDFAAE